MIKKNGQFAGHTQGSREYIRTAVGEPDELERKIIALFSLGTSYQDIRRQIADMYGITVFNGTISAVTDKLSRELQA